MITELLCVVRTASNHSSMSDNSSYSTPAKSCKKEELSHDTSQSCFYTMKRVFNLIQKGPMWPQAFIPTKHETHLIALV